jgi:hypothetical protein
VLTVTSETGNDDRTTAVVKAAKDFFTEDASVIT